jgi:hypothetical protein
MNAIQIEIGDRELSVLKQLAEKRNLSPQECLERIVQDSLKELHDLQYWNERGKHGDLERFRQILAKAPDTRPIHGDELPP